MLALVGAIAVVSAAVPVTKVPGVPEVSPNRIPALTSARADASIASFNW